MSALNKSLLFILGLVLGITAGAGFFIFKMDDLLKNEITADSGKDTLTIYKQEIKNEKKQNDPPETKELITKKDTIKKSMYAAKELIPTYTPEITNIQAVTGTDSLDEKMSLNKDTLSVVIDQNAVETFVIKKDELLDSRIFKVVNQQNNNESTTPSDSLMAALSGIKKIETTITSLIIEFWQSPINYKGYKMTKNKVVLFGIRSDENISFFQSEDAIFMKRDQNYYKLYFTDDFKQYEKVNDPLILSKLGQ